jgi:ferrous iron transport protein A
MKIKEMKLGSKAKVTGYSKSSSPYRQKLLSMGLIRGAELTLTRKAPLGDPVEIKIHSFSLTLRGDEADALEVEEIAKS